MNNEAIQTGPLFEEKLGTVTISSLRRNQQFESIIRVFEVNKYLDKFNLLTGKKALGQ